MTILDSVILGVVEGLTEFLPISSTAHLILTSRLLGLEVSEFLKSFEIVIQSGAILAVVYLYWETLAIKRFINWKIIVAFIPTAIVGLIFYNLIKDVLFENHLVSVYTILFGGIILIFFEVFHREKEEDGGLEGISFKQAVAIGLFQSLAVVPGVSRAAATIVGGMISGLRRKTAVEFSFLLAIPTIIAASGLDLIRSANSFSSIDTLNLGVGFIVSFVMAVVSIKFLLRFVESHDLRSFGVYRIVLALVFLFLLY